jgi:hypothetical protein
MTLLRKSGVLAFITSNSYIKANYGLPLRKFLGSKNTVCALLNIEGSQIFESAIVNTSIMILLAGKHASDRKTLVTNKPFNEPTMELFLQKSAICITASRFACEQWILESENKLLLLDKINSSGEKLSNLGAKIRLGIATGDNKAFILSKKEYTELIKADPKNKQILKPILRGRDIFRYHYNTPHEYVILAKNGINIPNEYPVIAEHLNSFGDNFKKRGAQGQNWWNLRACDFYDDFKKDKIVWIELTDKGRFAICTEELYCINSAYFMICPAQYNILFLTALLNSSLIEFFVKNNTETSGMGTMRWINNVISNIPVSMIEKREQTPIAYIVNNIIAAKQANPNADTSVLEAEIDKMVYTLYDLTEDDITIVEGKNG